ncbi:putative ABC transporter permease subunit [Deinococcus yavapaiensis]|uniref:ABC-2 type transport system permease protein n=1 Tax=Deinococcus yavapaiensis KR-236 TaxID=694435 RepID=A0A318STC9_9DEIO|nr:hypothetical protein [Deinococcus yavapaiensis]PYE56496.1 ABC-2 type transport system permease protein [Deinococcus yavapaiensis KR-236]
MSGSLPGLKARGLINTLARGPKVTFVVLGVLGALFVWGEVEGTMRALRFLGDFGDIGLAVFRRVLEIGFVVLSAGVTFSAVTTAISTLYLSEDLNFLLTQPLATRSVFAMKVFETYLAAALVPTALTLPIAWTIGAFLHAAWWYYPVALIAVILVYALPVGLGAALAVLLMRVAPVGRVREVATALGVFISAALVLVIRAARPENLLRQLQNTQEFDRLLRDFASPSNPFLPPAWGANGLWLAATGNPPISLVPLAILAALVLGGAALLATHAYQQGWARAIDSSRVKLDPTPKRASAAEGFAARFGKSGVLAFKDTRLLFRDPTQWSQLLILAALAGVYLVSVRSVPLAGFAQFQNILGYIQLAFQGFVITGVGVRLAFPAVSLEGRAYWLLRTSPIDVRQLVVSKYLGALPPTMLLALVLAYFSARVLNLTDVVVLASVVVALSNALVITALGIGLGAAFPKLNADNPAEIGLSPGGLLYMLGSLAYSVLLLIVLARPTYLSVTLPDAYPGLSAFTEPLGALALLGVLALTVIGTLAPLVFGWRRLDRLE